MSRYLGWVALLFMMVTFCCCGGLVFADISPAERVGEDGRISLRNESRKGGGSFFVGYGRSHRGGGVRGGK